MRPDIDIDLATVQQWAFQRDPCDVNTDAIQEDSVLSRVGPERRPSYVAILDRYGVSDETSSEAQNIETGSAGTSWTQQTKIFEGETYKLAIRR